MISAVFVDRPRLAIVIAILMTLAGLLSLLRIPVAQFPDIVPPQVTISTTFAGASAAVVEQTVAQPLEAQIVGADKMIYMKSTSGNDGSYSLTVSFELGTDPDIDTVNVNNRVQQALSRLPNEVQRFGLTVRKRSAAILEFLQFYSEGGSRIRCSSAITSTTTYLTGWRAHRAWAIRCCSAGSTIRFASGSR